MYIHWSVRLKRGTLLKTRRKEKHTHGEVLEKRRKFNRSRTSLCVSDRLVDEHEEEQKLQKKERK